jgi:anti-sigma28 factor (negative regulator of flagellin synthesis)
MTNVHHVESTPLSRLVPARRDRSAVTREPEARSNTEPNRADQVEFSESARALSDLNNSRSGIRADLVARVRAEIEAGTYVTDEKIDAAINAIASELDR